MRERLGVNWHLGQMAQNELNEFYINLRRVQVETCPSSRLFLSVCRLPPRGLAASFLTVCVCESLEDPSLGGSADL